MLRPMFARRILAPPKSPGTCSLIALLLMLQGSSMCFAAQGLPTFDFAVQGGTEGWVAQHDASMVQSVGEGLTITLTGSDPYVAGPARDYPAGKPLWLRVRLRSDQGGMMQVFYFAANPTEEHSVRFAVPAASWFEGRVPMPPLGVGHRLRLDPPGAGGTCTVASIRFEERIQHASPSWPVPGMPALDGDVSTLESGDLKLSHGKGFGDFVISVDGMKMAIGNRDSQLGYLSQGKCTWVKLGGDSGLKVKVQAQPLEQFIDRQVGGRVSVKAEITDADGGHWEINQIFSLGAAGTLGVETVIQVDQDRDILYMPVFTLLAGVGSFGTNKTQALLAGIEYLENEPSSSTADLNPPASNRQVPDTAKLTFPLMVLSAEDRYVALAWNREANENLCAVFDSPDRFFQSGGHVMGLLFPGSDGVSREEHSLLPYDAVKVKANRQLRFSHLLLAGRGRTMVPAVQQYVRLFGLPALPKTLKREAFYELSARGWLDSKIRDGDKFRHAAPGFGSSPASDAALYLEWLAGKVDSAGMAGRLRSASSSALSIVPKNSLLASQVGHIRSPAPALAFGGVAECLQQQLSQAKSMLKRFEPDGTVGYRRGAPQPDYGRTHWAPHANGTTSAVLAQVLRTAVLTRDEGLVAEGLRLLRACRELYRDSVPRGAQTWEIPLHTPDILASAYLVDSFVLGYELTGDESFLEDAKYWAWTGVPFVYLTPPTSQPVGNYSTIAVLGATSWVAPNWIGLPVQWCGLVYADALYQLERHDSKGPWKTIADGICLAGIQHTYGEEDRDYLGLLPDSFSLRTQTRNGPAINPATLLAPSLRMFGDDLAYDYLALRERGVSLHAPGRIKNLKESENSLSFEVAPWKKDPSWLLVSGLKTRPKVLLNGVEIQVTPPHEWNHIEGWLTVQIQGATTVELRK